MRFNNVVIDSFAYEVPPHYYSSEDIEQKLSPVYKRLKLPEGRLELQTGIKTRGFWKPGTRPSSIALSAAKKVFDKTNIKKQDIDLLIFGSVCRDYLEPSTASAVHYGLELSPHCQSFDVSNACLGVLNGMEMAARMIEAGQIKNALIVSGENGGPLLEETMDFLNTDESLTRKSIKKYIANLTIGSAGVAVLMSHKDVSDSTHRLLGSHSLADTSTNKLCQGSGDTSSLMMETHSEEMLHAGVKLAQENWNYLKQELDWSNESYSKVITHQVGTAHRNLLFEKLNIERSKDFSTFEKLGNTGSAALPITFMMAHEQKFLNPGDKISFLGIGSGLNTMMMGVQW